MFDYPQFAMTLRDRVRDRAASLAAEAGVTIEHIGKAHIRKEDPKQGDCSVGVARQWSGRLGKVDNCQVAVFGVLTDGRRHAPVDMRLYLPNAWIEDPARCDAAGVPETARKLTSKSGHALDIVRQARAR
jgi:SRSO17 transposase